MWEENSQIVILEEEEGVNFPGDLCDALGDLVSMTDPTRSTEYLARVDCTSWIWKRAISVEVTLSINAKFLMLPIEHMKYGSGLVTEAAEHNHEEVTEDPPVIRSHILCLKIGAPIAQLHNLNPLKL